MNLHHLNIFLNVSVCGSISAGAKEMNISQSALSRELKVFEDRLGIALFERLPRGMMLTPAGRVLENYARSLFAIANDAEQAMRELASGRSGQLAIGASNTIGLYLLPALIVQLTDSHPGVDVTLFIGNTRQVCEGLKEQRFDLGLIEGTVQQEEWVVDTLCSDRLLPVVSPSSELCARKTLQHAGLGSQSLLLREPGSGTREQTLNLLQQRGIRPQRMVEFNQTEAIKQALLSGAGIAWLPGRAVLTELASGSLVWLSGLELEISRPLSAIRRKNTPPNRLAEQVIGWLQEGGGSTAHNED